MCVCFRSFLRLLKPQFSSLQNGQTMILASISPRFSQRGSLYFDDTVVSGNSVSPTLLPQASYKNQPAGKTVSHGGRRGYSAQEGLQRHSFFMKFPIFQPPPSPQGYGPVRGGGTAWEGVLTLLQGGRTLQEGTVCKGTRPWGDLRWCLEARMSGTKLLVTATTASLGAGPSPTGSGSPGHS